MARRLASSHAAVRRPAPDRRPRPGADINTQDGKTFTAPFMASGAGERFDARPPAGRAGPGVNPVRDSRAVGAAVDVAVAAGSRTLQSASPMERNGLHVGTWWTRGAACASSSATRPRRAPVLKRPWNRRAAGAGRVAGDRQVGRVDRWAGVAGHGRAAADGPAGRAAPCGWRPLAREDPTPVDARVAGPAGALRGMRRIDRLRQPRAGRRGSMDSARFDRYPFVQGRLRLRRRRARISRIRAPRTVGGRRMAGVA